MTECDYCGTDILAYEFQTDRGPVARCLSCLAIERAQSQVRMPFDAFMDTDASESAVYDTDEEMLESRRSSYENCRSWLRILGRIRQDRQILQGEDDDAIHEYAREFLINTLGSDAYATPSEIVESDGDVAQQTFGDGGGG